MVFPLPSLLYLILFGRLLQLFECFHSESFKLGAGLNPTVLEALILILSPVCGFLPALAFRLLTVKVPNPG